MSPSDTILLTALCTAVACALPGCFLLLRGMSLIGDAISHAVLPGIVAAVMLTGSLSSAGVIVGAGLVGLLTVVLIELLHGTRRVKEDASIAVVFPALFALGVLLVSQYAGNAHIDAECVFYGEIAVVPFDTTTIAGFELSRPLLVLGLFAVLNVTFVLLFYKELEVATFDKALAATVGLSPVLVHYLLMGMVSFTTVATFEIVGAILVVAFLVVPAATAHLLTDRLHRMLPLAAGIGAASSAAGYYVARALDVSISGAMTSVMGVVFLLTWLCAPREGVLARRWRRRRVRRRFELALMIERLLRAPADEAELSRDLSWPREQVEDVLARLRDRGYLAGQTPTPAAQDFLDLTVR